MSEQKQRVYDALNKLGIKYEVVEHEPVHTMEDMDRLGLPEKGTVPALFPSYGRDPGLQPAQDAESFCRYADVLY